MEKWAIIPEAPHYEVSNLANVRNRHRGNLLTMRINQKGIMYIGVQSGGVQIVRALAPIVAAAFVENPFGETANTPIHLDGNKANCRADNLRWRERHFAIRYHQQFKEPYFRRINTPIWCVETDEYFQDSWEAAKRYGLLERAVVLSCAGVIDKAGPEWLTFEVDG